MKHKHQSKDSVFVLSIDGGGIRGIIPVMVLMEMERLLGVREAEKPLSAYFDLIAGTSTGGMIALSLSAPGNRLNFPSPLDFSQEQREKGQNYSLHSNWGFREMYNLRFAANKQIPAEATDAQPAAPFTSESSSALKPKSLENESGPSEKHNKLVAAFRKLARKAKGEKKSLQQESVDLKKILNIYEERGEEIFPKSTFRQLQSLSQVFGDKYSEESLEQLLESIFSDITVHEAQQPVFVTTYDFYSGKPYLITSYDNEDYYMKDAARATTAAPTYFSPHYVQPLGDTATEYYLIDGGVAANNPALLSYFEAKRLYPEAKQINIISLGTAARPYFLPADQSVRGGFIGWMDPAKGSPLYRVLRSSQSGITDYALSNLPDVRYYRLDGSPGTRHVRLDDASKENIALLKHIGKTIVQEKHDLISSFCDLLIRRKE
ncbi:MAG: patatin-like phospholipase family protein [Spirochaetota bacterium]